MIRASAPTQLEPCEGPFSFCSLLFTCSSLHFLSCLSGRAVDEVRRPRLAVHLEHVLPTADHYGFSFVGAEIPLEDDYPNGNYIHT
jgi:hypothetical protein